MSTDDPSAGSSAGMSAPPSSQPLPQQDPMVGQVLDARYKVVKKLGEGGMGEVYAAEHIHIEKRLAVKLLRPEIVTNEEAVGRFRQEARSASSIGHKNIIGIEDFGTLPDGRIYLCMELLEGQPLNDMLEQPMDPVRLVNILIQTGHGLAAAHAKGIIHRDMKPENIFVTTGDVPKLLDFGIAKVSQGEGENHLTRTGTIFGTPFYMAPEQALGQAVDHRADIYAMGVIMYECFCGSVPFQGESFMGILTQHITAEPMPPEAMAQQHGRVLPPGLADIISRCMAKDPNHRFQSMDELVEALVQVYRIIAGAGMSTYLEAQKIPPSGVMSAQHSATSGYPSRANAPTPFPGQSGPVPSAAYASGGYASDASQSFPAAKKKSKAGLFIAIFAVLAVAGAGGGYLYYASNNGGETTKKGSGQGENPLAQNGQDAEGDAGQAAGNDTKGDAGTAVAATQDASTAVTAGADAGAVVTVDASVVQVKPVFVLVDSKPQRAAVYRDGKKLKDLTPTNVKVTPGQPVELELKRRGYHDHQVSLDGSKNKIVVRMKSKRSGNTTSNGDNTVVKPPQPKRCSPKWCKLPANRSAMCCMLE